MKHLRWIAILCLALSQGIYLFSQSDIKTDNSDESKIVRDWKILRYENRSALKLNWPQRKHDSPFFCDELIPYKNGLIINSITSNRSGHVIDVKTAFFYFDLQTKKLSRLGLPQVDTIESIIPDSDGGIFCAYKTKGVQMLGFFSNGAEQNIATQAPFGIRAGLDSSKWIKLGYANGSLFVLSPSAVYSYSKNQWQQVISYSLDTFYLNVLHYRRSMSTLPTRNITVTEKTAYFLQEIVQDRQCRLFMLDLKNGRVSDFFLKQGYTDNYQKEINDYSITKDGSLFVAASRLMRTDMSLIVNDVGSEVWTFGNLLNDENGKIPVSVSTAGFSGDIAYLAGGNGLFLKNQDTVRPLLLWKGTHQTIRDNGESIDFEFVPRNLIVRSDHSFIIGGIYGGLYLIDMLDGRIICYDDLAEKKIGKIYLNNL